MVLMIIFTGMLLPVNGCGPCGGMSVVLTLGTFLLCLRLLEKLQEAEAIALVMHRQDTAVEALIKLGGFPEIGGILSGEPVAGLQGNTGKCFRKFPANAQSFCVGEHLIIILTGLTLQIRSVTGLEFGQITAQGERLLQHGDAVAAAPDTKDQAQSN